MRAFEIPETRADQIAWLESEMLGTQLHSLVAELTAVHGVGESSSNWTDSIRDAVRFGGFATLSDVQFSSLLQDSRQLLAIQRDVLEHGGRYWSEVPSPVDLQINPQFEPPGSDVLITPKPISGWKSNLLWATVASLATAAALLLFVLPPLNTKIAESPEPPSTINSQAPNQVVDRPPWGFAKFAAGVEESENDLDPPLNRKTYLQELATAAEAWGNKKPDTPEALAQRIGEFRMGCSAILLATHEPLPEADRIWLSQRCKSWAAALDRHVTEIESGQPVDEVRNAVDSTVTKIAAALLGRADTPTG